MQFLHLPPVAARLAFAVLLFPVAIGDVLAADLPPVIRSAHSGPWSAAATWEDGKIPAAEARVLIRTGHRVVYDVKSDVTIRSVNVAGTLTFDPDRDTRLDVGLIVIRAAETYCESGFDCEAHVGKPDPAAERPALEVGTPNRPISGKHTALIRLCEVSGLDRESCPAIVCCGGRMDFHGQPMSRTWVKLGAPAGAGGSIVTLAEAVTGWRVGDRVVLTATRCADTGPNQTEERVIKTIDGKKLTVDEPIEYIHLAEADYCGEVANLSRNVVVESDAPKGVRGHTMYHKHSAGSISYAEFRHLGKKGLLGRYSLHYHLCGDTMRGSSVIGASIHDSDNRFLTIHGTDYLVVRDCVGYKSVGHGFFMEDGTEVFNVLDRNLAVGALEGDRLPDQVLRADDNSGAGFWWANGRNTLTRNVSADSRYGFHFHPMAGGWYQRPEFAVRGPDGKVRKEDLRALSFVRFEGNEAHGASGYGMRLEWSSVSGDRLEVLDGDPRDPFIVRDLRIWECYLGHWTRLPAVRAEKVRIDKVVGYDGSPETQQGTKAEPRDTLPPTTVITHVTRNGGRAVVRGTTADNGTVRRVVVNGKEARSVGNNFAEWEVTLDDVPAGPLRVKAHAEDAAKNVEPRPHVVTVAE